jgi:mercuric ion transport protein
MDHIPRIELVYDLKCPNVDRAREHIARALRELGAPETWIEWDRDAEDTPISLRHFGSPTVLVDGHDVGCDETGAPQAQANSCRVYFDKEGKCLCGAPSAQLILETIYSVVEQ